MISFQPREEEREFVQVARRLATKIRQQGQNMKADSKVWKRFVTEVEAVGLLEMEAPTFYGGLEMPLLSQVLVYEALAYGDLAIVQSFPGLNDGASFLRACHERGQKILLPETEEKLRTVAWVDHRFPSGELHLERKGNRYFLSGRTYPVRLGAIATDLILAVYDQEEVLHLFWLNHGENRWQIERAEDYLGLKEAQLARISFQDEEVGREQILAKGKEAEVFLRRARKRIHLIQASKALGLMQAAVDFATAYTAERQAFGRPIASFQGVSFKVAQMVIETRVVRNLLLQAAWAIDEGKQEAEGYSLRAIHRAHRGVRFVTDSAVQLLGGHGYVRDYPVEKWMRDAQAQVLLYGKEDDFLIERGRDIVSKVKGRG